MPQDRQFAGDDIPTPGPESGAFLLVFRQMED